ncbi:MAG: hypothetical protein QNJ30_12235 [Kiloniellales bacterium]|nr:hypothetical protein [Kiloniellales bacterium]
MPRLVIPLLLALLAGCSSGADLGEEWIAVTEADFPLVFAPDELEGAIARYLRSTRYRNGRAILTHRASWKRAGARLPRAALRLEQYGPGFVLAQNAEQTLTRAVASVFAGRRPLILAQDQGVNSLGSFDYLRVRDGEAECAVFVQSWRRRRILNTLVGHYCVAPDPGLTAARIESALRSLREK